MEVLAHMDFGKCFTSGGEGRVQYGSRQRARGRDLAYRRGHDGTVEFRTLGAHSFCVKCRVSCVGYLVLVGCMGGVRVVRASKRALGISELPLFTTHSPRSTEL